MRSQRSSLPITLVQTASDKIAKQVLKYIDWNDVSNVHVYQSIAKLREVDTNALIESIELRYPKIKIYHPNYEPTKLDIVLVPLLAFDIHGNRIGMGGGYYDRFLKKHPNAKKIGLAFELQKIESAPAEPHDVRLDTVITEHGVYTFNNKT